MQAFRLTGSESHGYAFLQLAGRALMTWLLDW